MTSRPLPKGYIDLAALRQPPPVTTLAAAAPWLFATAAVTGAFAALAFFLAGVAHG